MYTPLFRSYISKPSSQVADSDIWLMHLIRNNFTITTWLLIGASLQSALVLLPMPKKYAVTPALAYLLFQVVDTLLMTLGIKRNRYMDGVILGKHSALIPCEDGTFGEEGRKAKGARGDQVVVLLLSARINHPLGLFAPGAKEFGELMGAMNTDLEGHAEEFGWLGGTQWQNGGSRTATTDMMFVHYFRDLESLHNFAHSKSHRLGWDWYNRFAKTNKHIGVNHEVYLANQWENIYLNEAPTGFGTTVFPTEEHGQRRWARPIVDASKGKLRSSSGRIGLDDGTGNEKYGEEPWKNAVV